MFVSLSLSLSLAVKRYYNFDNLQEDENEGEL